MAQTHKPRLPKKIRRSRRVESPAESREARDSSFGDLADEIRKYLSETSENPLRDAISLHGIIAESTPIEIRETRAKADRSGGSAAGLPLKRPASKTSAAKREEAAREGARSGSIAERASGRQPLSPELDVLLESVLEQPEAWLKAPNPRFRGARPADLVGTEDESKIIDILRAVDLGLF